MTLSAPKITEIAKRTTSETETIVRQTRVMAPPEATEIPPELIDIVNLVGTGYLYQSASGWVLIKPKDYTLALSELTSPGWVRLGLINCPLPQVMRFDLSMIRGNTGKAAPSDYSLSVSANEGGDEGVCYFGAQLNCIYGDDYTPENDDPLLAVALVRRPGYGSRTADLLIQHQGTSFALCLSTSDPVRFAWNPSIEPAGPGTGDDVTIARRRIIYTA